MSQKSSRLTSDTATVKTFPPHMPSGEKKRKDTEKGNKQLPDVQTLIHFNKSDGMGFITSFNLAKIDPFCEQSGINRH